MSETKNQIQNNSKTKQLPIAFIDKDKFILLLLGLTILFVFIARMHLLSFPLERDEGEYAYMGRLILNGHPPYTLAYNMKLPGTYYMYALFMKLFGESTAGIHMGLALISAASMFLVYLISGNFVSKTSSVISTASFGIMGTSWTLLGQAAHATHFVTFFALLGIHIVLRLYKNEKHRRFMYFVSGIFFSLAFICKQSGIFFVFFGLVIILTRELNRGPFFNLFKNMAFFFSGFAAPVLSLFFYLYLFSDFDKFWFWTVSYLMKYGSQIPLSLAPAKFKIAADSITGNYSSAGYVALWAVSLMGIPFIFIIKSSIQNKILIVSFLVFSFFTVLPGFIFTAHYFLTFLPAAALSIAVFFEFFKLKNPNLAPVCFPAFLLLMGSGIKANTDYLFKQNPELSCKKVYASNPFAESIEIAEFLKHNTTREDKIAVLGSEPQIYFYADRYSATGYLYTYSLMEIQSYALSMQKEMIGEIEKNKPRYIVFVNLYPSWGVRSKSETFVLKWADEYLNKNYTLIGIYDVFPEKISSLKILDPIQEFSSKSHELIYISERKSV